MAVVDAYSRSLNELNDATQVVREFAGSDVSRAVITLMDALAASYCLDLITVKPEGLVRLQSALKQVTSIRDTLAGDRIDVPKI